MKKLLISLSGLLAFGAAAETVSVKSPDGLNEIRLETEPVLTYSVLRAGVVRVPATPITLTVSGRPALGGAENHAYAGRTARARAGRVPAPVYKKAHVDDDGNEVLVRFKGDWGVALHARNDGVAWRFETAFGGDVTVPAEGTEVRFPSGATLLYGRTWGGLESSWESVYEFAASCAEIPAGRDRFVYLPLTVSYPDGAAMCVTESNVWDYPGLNFYRPESRTDALLSWQAQEPVVTARKGVHVHVKERRPYLTKTTGTRAYPWRVFLLAKDAPALAESDAVWALAEPCRIADTSWIKPGATAWNWWCANRLGDTGFPGRFDTRTFKAYIDFAASVGLPYMLVDAGWVRGFEGEDLDVINPAFDLDALVAYGRERKVDLILWAAWSDLADKQRRRRLFRAFAARGVKGFKIDFFDRDDREIADVTSEMARDAAENRLVLDFHGMHKPVGLSRTYPNVLNYEGVHGMEQEKFGGSAKTDFPANDVKAVYTRMLAGPMDYTPGAMGNVTRAAFKPSHDHPVAQGTRAHQLAMYVLYEAPLQMLSDSPTDYRATPENLACAKFMASVPTVWDDVKGVGGELGRWVALARRKGDAWYAGAMTDWTGRTVELDTSFLGAGDWAAEIWADAPDAATEPTHYVKASRTVRAGEKLAVALAPGGGWAARFTRK